MANYALAGEAVVDFPTAYTASPLFDGNGWNVDACAERGVTVDRMPRVEAPGVTAGRLRATGAVLAVGAIDALCEQMVAGADDDGDVLVLCGTTLIVWVTIPEARQVPGLWTIPHMTGKSQIGGASNAGGLFLGWVDRVLGPGDPVAVDPRRVPVWSPYLRGERTPFHDPDRRGMLDGLDLTHDAATLRRAAYEASGFVVRQLVELSRGESLANCGRRRRYSSRAVAAGHRRRHRSTGGGVRGGRGSGAGCGFPQPYGGRPRIVDHRRRPMGRRRAHRPTRSGLDGPDGGPLRPVSPTWCAAVRGPGVLTTDVLR